LLHLFTDGRIIISYVRKKTIAAVFYTICGISETAAAAVCKTVQRTVTKQTAEILPVGAGMAGEKFTVPVLEKIIVAHILTPLHL